MLAGRKSGLEVNFDKTKYMDMSRDQNAGRRYSKILKIVPLKDGSVRIFGNNLTLQNCIEEEFKGRSN